MRTKAKLILGALGFVAATTGLVIWQSMPPRLEAVARRVPFGATFFSFVAWLSPKEVVISCHESESLCLLDLERGTTHPIPFTHSEGFVQHATRVRFIDESTVSASPDGKWLAFVEQIEQGRAKPVQRSLVLMHPDSTGLRRVAPLEDKSGLRLLWQPNSQGFLFYWESDRRPKYGRTFYALDENVPPREEWTRDYDGFRDSPPTIQADGRLLVVRNQNQLTVALCDQNQPEHRESLVFARPAGREKAQVETFLVSHDSQWAVVSLRVEAAKIPERETWEELLQRKLPVAYNELWVLSAKGEKPRCLVREATTSERASAFFLNALSPDGKHALVHGSQNDYFVLPLSRS
ncbi:MAG: hypothetical protein NTX57_19610 [Armatimonadetes bacterium]|nr:hypothetical protein [Armatimonadota bacterium]